MPQPSCSRYAPILGRVHTTDVFAAQDMGLAAEIAAKEKSALPLGLAARDLYSKVVSEEPSLARKDFSSVYKFLEKKA